MKSNLFLIPYRFCLAALMSMSGATMVRAQSAPEMREILNRLDRLEKDNQALMQEIRLLRQELGSRGGPTSESSAPQAPAGPELVPEQLALQQNRIDELAQTRVEASERFPLRVTGMALFNAYVNGRSNNNTENPTIASQTPADATGGAQASNPTQGAG